MNEQITNYIEKIEASVLYDLVTTDTSDLYIIASDLIENNKEDYKNICQAYEVVKHELLGN